MQGRKKYQRRQWVRDQEMYFGTKYLMNTVVGDNNRITFRCYDPGNDVAVPKDYSLSITPFQDMYVSAMFGNGDQRQIRAKAGQTVVLNFSVSTTTDTQVTIYGANRISALNDLSACYIAANNFSMATKLRKLVLGNTTPGYSNPRLTSLTLGSNKLLEELDLRNCGNLTGTLNLANCSNLIKLYADGTRISSVTFATNGKVQIAHLPSTLNTLVMRNLNNLEDFQCSMDYLEQLTLQGGTLNNLEIVNDVIDTLEVAYLYDLDWTLPDSSLLNKLLNISSSILTGSVYVNGAIRLKELERYAAKWADLTVTYNPNYLVEQYIATYVNDDGTQLYQDFVDRGGTPIDPVATGAIPTPTKSSDAQYTYTFSGWDDIDSVMLSARTITAQYTSNIRTYTVTWYSRAGVPIKSVQAQYGAEVVYDGEIPTRTDEEASFRYNIFTGWDKSTGFITGDTDVYAIWDTANLPAKTATTPYHAIKELNDMSPAEIYGLATANIDVNEYLDLKDYKDITVGNDFSFSNVESAVLCQNQWFDGTNRLDTGIKLFDSDSESFTLAIDFEFYSTNIGGSLAACFEEEGNEGFRLRYMNGPNIQWGDKNYGVGSTNRRGMCVLRHIKGSNRLHVYAFNTSEQSLDETITYTELNRSRDTSTSIPLTFGAVKYPDGGYDYYATGWIHWCKIWYQDLGDYNARLLAAWPHEVWRAEYCGTNRYRLGISGTSARAKLTFILNNLLEYGRWMNSSYSNAGGYPATNLREVLQTRIYNALPTWMKSIIKKVRVNSSAGNRSQEIVYSDDYVYIPAVAEIGNTSGIYAQEAEPINWFSSDRSRIKFRGLIIPDGSQNYTSSEDPTSTSATVNAGDTWYYNYNYYAYIPPEVASKHKYTTVSGDNITAADGGLWLHSSEWWTRSPHIDYDYQFIYISQSGYTYWGNSAYTEYALDLMFSI